MPLHRRNMSDEFQEALALNNLIILVRKFDVFEDDVTDVNPKTEPAGLAKYRQNTSVPSGVSPMRKRHTAGQIAQALRQAEAGTPIADIIRTMGVHENTFYPLKHEITRSERTG